jgi:hypothetical protein
MKETVKSELEFILKEICESPVITQVIKSQNPELHQRIIKTFDLLYGKVHFCESCGNPNVLVEWDGIYCPNCTHWKSTKE